MFNTLTDFKVQGMTLDDGKRQWTFSQILRSYSLIILFIHQINWLILTHHAAVHCGPECVWLLIAGARHLHPWVLHFSWKIHRYMFFRLLSNMLFQRLSLPSSLIIVSLNIEAKIHSGNCIDWLRIYKALPSIDVSEDALNLSSTYRLACMLRCWHSTVRLQRSYIANLLNFTSAILQILWKHFLMKSFLWIVTKSGNSSSSP